MKEALYIGSVIIVYLIIRNPALVCLIHSWDFIKSNFYFFLLIFVLIGLSIKAFVAFIRQEKCKTIKIPRNNNHIIMKSAYQTIENRRKYNRNVMSVIFEKIVEGKWEYTTINYKKGEWVEIGSDYSDIQLSIYRFSDTLEVYASIKILKNKYVKNELILILILISTAIAIGINTAFEDAILFIFIEVSI